MPRSARRPDLDPSLVVSKRKARELVRTANRVADENALQWDPSEVSALVGLIYDAALKPELWPAFLEASADAIGGRATALMMQELEPGEGGLDVAGRWDPDYIRSYRDYYTFVNHGVPVGKNLYKSGGIGPGDCVLPNDCVLHSEFGEDWVRPQSLRHQFGGTILCDGSTVSALNSYRAPHESRFGPREMALVKALMPHLQRALQVHRRVQKLERERDEARAVLDRLGTGAIVVDGRGEALFVNASAEKILLENDGLTLAGGSLGAGERAESAELARVVREAAATVNGDDLSSGGVLAISRRSMRRPYSVVVAPLRASDDALARAGASALVLVSDPESDVDCPQALLARLYQLTPAEARFCALFAEGKSPERIAEELGITVQTSRLYLKRVLAKTDTHRQSELGRLLLRSLPSTCNQRSGSD